MGSIVAFLLGKKCQAVLDKERNIYIQSKKAKLQKAEQSALWAAMHVWKEP